MIGVLKNYCILLFGLLACLAASLSMAAEALTINFIVVENKGVYREIVTLTEQALRKKNIALNSTIIEVKNLTGSPLPPADSIVTIGTKAAAVTYQHYPQQQVTSALLTMSGFQKIASQAFGSSDNALKTVTPLLLDQPYSRFFALGSLLAPAAKSVGILVGPSNAVWLAEIKQSAKVAGLDANVALLNLDANPVRIIEPVIKKSDFVIVLPDKNQINQLTAKWVLPLSYRYRKPVIAYSKKYVDAGALASVFSSPADISKSIAEHLQGKQLREDHHSLFFSTSLNTSVARSLGIKSEVAEELESKLRSLEGVSP